MILAALMACGSEELLQVPATLSPDFKSSIVQLETGSVTVHELHLVDRQGTELGRIPGEATLDVLGDTVELETAELASSGWSELRGELVAASFTGALLVEDGELPFDLVLGEQDGRIYGGEVQDELPEEDPEALPEELALEFDALLALTFLDWSGGDLDGDGTLTEADGDNAEALAFGLRSGLVWSVDVQELSE